MGHEELYDSGCLFDSPNLANGLCGTVGANFRFGGLWRVYQGNSPPS